MNSIKLIAVLFAALLIPSCAAILPAAKTVKDIARNECKSRYGVATGLSLEDVAKIYCNHEWVLDVFLACEGDAKCLDGAVGKSMGLMGAKPQRVEPASK